MCRSIPTLLLLLAACGELHDYQDTAGPSHVSIRLVDDNQPARGVRVRVVDEKSRPLGEGLTNDDGVASIALSASGDAFLVVNEGAGRGTLVRFTAIASGKNDLGERAITTLSEFPELVTLRGVDFEERLTASTDGFVRQFTLAKNGAVAVEVLGSKGARVLHHDFTTGETRTLREVEASTQILAVQVVEGVIAWWVEWAAQGQTSLHAIDLRTGEPFPVFAPPVSIGGQPGQFKLSDTLAWLADDHRLQLAIPSPNFEGNPWRYEGVSLEATGQSGLVPLLSATSRFLWPATSQRALYLMDGFTGRVVAFDATDFRNRGEMQFPGRNQRLIPSDECVLSSNELGLFRGVPGQPVEQLLPPSEDPLGWVLAGPPGEQRWLQGRLEGSATLVLVDCRATIVRYAAPAGSCDPSCIIDAHSAPDVRLVEQTMVGETQRRLSVKRWVLGQSEATELWHSAPLLIANYSRGEAPVLELSNAYATVQLSVGIPEQPGTFHTWLPASRTYREVGDGRLVYLMRDPLTERQQLFTLGGTP